MSGLSDLCSHLADGTETQQKHAWEELILQAKLPYYCRECVKRVRLRQLEDSFHKLCECDSGSLSAPTPSPNDTAARLDWARRWVAAAVVAMLTKRAAQDSTASTELARWGYRGARLREVDPPDEMPVPLDWAKDSARPASPINRCFRLLGEKYGDLKTLLAPARVAALTMAGEYEPAYQLLNIPLLLVAPQRSEQAHVEEPSVARLSLELVPNGLGQFFFDPRCFCNVLSDFENAANRAWERVQFDEHDDVVWRIEGVDLVDGPSAQAAMQVALMLLKESGPYERSYAISATLDDDGTLQGVDGLAAGLGQAGAKLIAAKDAGLKRVIISKTDFADLSPSAPGALGLEIIPAERVDEARNLVSGLLSGMKEYFQRLIEAPDSLQSMAPYLGGHTHTDLYVEPDVLKREERLGVRGFRPALMSGGIGTEESAMEQSSHMRTASASETLDIGENPYVERDSTNERRVAWVEERSQILRGSLRFAVILAPPGQGKSLLAEMTAYQVATHALCELTAQRVDVDSVEMPIVTPLSKLTEREPLLGESAEEWLRASLSLVLREKCPETLARYLSAHAHERRVCLFLDALDEVQDTAQLARIVEALSGWTCSVIITSRPYGYEHRAPLFAKLSATAPVYRLAPFDRDQSHSLASKWFGASERLSHLNELLSRSPSAQRLSQNPFLLTLLCWVVSQDDVSPHITRTELYDRMAGYLLGVPASGIGSPDEQRVQELSPLFADLSLAVFLENEGKAPFCRKRLLEIIAESPNRPVPLDDKGGRLRIDDLTHVAPMQQADFLINELCHKRLLIPDAASRGGYVVPHRSILEYFAGYELARRFGSLPVKQRKWLWRFVDKKAWAPDWEEVILFLAGRLRTPGLLLRLLSDEKKDDVFRNRLGLAARCLVEIPPMFLEQNSKLVDEITTAILACWWQHERDGTLDAVQHLGPALAAVGQANGRVRCTAIRARKGRHPQIKSQPVLTYLAESLGDQDRNVRCEAARLLGRIGAAAATPPVIGRLRDALCSRVWNEDEYFHNAAAHALTLIFARAGLQSHVVELLRRRDVNSKPVVDALAVVGPGAGTPEVLDCLTELAKGPMYLERETFHAVGQMGATAAGRFLPMLGGWINSPSPEKRRRALEALRSIGPMGATPRILKGLLNLLRDPDGDTDEPLGVCFALDGIGRAAFTPEICDRLAEMLLCEELVLFERPRLGTFYAYLMAEYVQATRQLIEHARKTLRDLLREYDQNKSAHTALKFQAVREVIAIGAGATSPEILQSLLELLSHPIADARDAAWKAMEVLCDFADPQAILYELSPPPDRNWLQKTALGAWRATPAIFKDLVHPVLAPPLPPPAVPVVTPEIRAALAEILHDPNKSFRWDPLRAVKERGVGALTRDTLSELAESLHKTDRWLPTDRNLERKRKTVAGLMAQGVRFFRTRGPFSRLQRRMWKAFSTAELSR